MKVTEIPAVMELLTKLAAGNYPKREIDRIVRGWRRDLAEHLKRQGRATPMKTTEGMDRGGKDYTAVQYSCGCTASGAADVPAYCPTHGCNCASLAPTYPVFRDTLHLPACPKFTEADRLLSALLESSATAEYMRGAISTLGVFRVLSHEEMARWYGRVEIREDERVAQRSCLLCGHVGDRAIYDEPSRVYVCRGCRDAPRCAQDAASPDEGAGVADAGASGDE